MFAPLIIATSGLKLSPLDTICVLICTAMVLLMQAGFCLLESGLSRAKHSINVAIKNLADLCVSTMLFWVVGFGVMFGASYSGWFGTSHFAPSTVPELLAFMAFQVVFCGTATTIVSGAVAERMRLSAYFLLTAVTAVLIYPVFGHWCWGGAVTGGNGWLEELGFIDFAGATVVHSVGGWIALAAVMILGPRRRRFNKQTGESRPMIGHNYPAAAAGVVLLWFGWLGFNGGSLLGYETSLPSVVVCTALAGAAGGCAAMAIGFALNRRVKPADLFGGIVAGLVAVTAGCHAYGPMEAVVIAMVAGLIYVISVRLLESAHIDDVVGAVPAHAVAGVWGTLAVALFAEESMLAGALSRWEQLGVQAIGVAACFAWSFGVGGITLLVLDRWLSIRVSEEAEEYGLNVVEHGTSTDIADLLHDMKPHREGDFSAPVHVEPFTEVGEIATCYNEVLDRFAAETEAREQAHDALRRAEAEYRLMFENTVEGVYRRRPDGRITAVNQAYAEMLGFDSPDALMGSANGEIERHYADERFPYDLNSEQVDGDYRTTITANGETRTILERVRTLRHDDGSVLWIQAAVADITEAIRAEQLQRDIDVANAASEAKSAFLASMSHELRTPLHGVTGMLELIESTDLNEQQQRLVGNARVSADSLLAQINDVLDLSKVESGALELLPVDFVLPTMVEESVSQFAPLLPTDHVELVCDLAADLPTTVHGDASRLRQILTNLIGNAVKFTDAGEVRVTVEKGSGDRVRFTVADTGPGLSPESLEAIFAPYVQVDAGRRHEQGTGLGLAICLELATHMGGELHVESEPGEGATFILTLPLPETLSAEQAESTSQAAAFVSDDATDSLVADEVDGPATDVEDVACDELDVEDALSWEVEEGVEELHEIGELHEDDVAGETPSLHVLVVDDRASNLDVLEKQLHSWGHTTIRSENPHAVEALLEASAENDDAPFFDVLIVDHHMPGRDGIEVAAGVRSDSRWGTLPIVVATSDPLGVPTEERELVDIAAVIQKPVRQSELYNVLLEVAGAAPGHESRDDIPTFSIDDQTVRVLVAEDNTINQCFVTHTLDSAGFESVVVDNGRQAVEAYIAAEEACEPFDVVFMDCQMPVLGGLDATREIRDWERSHGVPSVSIIALTADAIAGDREACLEAGMDDYLTKPIDTTTLIAAVDTVVRQRDTVSLDMAVPGIEIVDVGEVTPESDVEPAQVIETSEPADEVDVQACSDMPGAVTADDEALGDYDSLADHDSLIIDDVLDESTDVLPADEVSEKGAADAEPLELTEAELAITVVEMANVVGDECDSWIDVAELRNRCLDDDEFLLAVLQQFTQELPVERDRMRAAVATHDVEQVATAAHTMKGFAGNVTAQAVHDAAATVESLSREDAEARDDAVWRNEIDMLVGRIDSTLTAASRLIDELQQEAVVAIEKDDSEKGES